MDKCLKFQSAILIVFSLTQIGKQQACPSSSGENEFTCSTLMTFVNCKGNYLTAIPKISETAVEVNLDENNLTAVPRNAFSGLSYLQKLYLNKNNIGIVESFAFNGLSSLKYLYLRNNKISILNHKSFAGMPKLINLDLTFNNIQYVAHTAFDETSAITSIKFGCNNLTAIPCFGYQPYLKHVNLYNNSIVKAKFPPSFKDTTQRLAIVLCRNRIKKIENSTFASLANKSLSELDLSENTIETVDKNAFTAFRSIESLNFGQNWLNIESLRNVITGITSKSLKSLDLSDNDLSTYTIETSLAYLVNATLKIIRLRSNSMFYLTDNMFSKLKELSELDLSRNKIWYVSDTAFNGLGNLKILNLYHNYLQTVPKDMPATLRSLYLSNNEIKRLGSKVFRNFHELKELNLEQNKIVDLRSSAFNDLINVEKLNLGKNNIKNLSKSIFLPLGRLMYLDLSNNKFYFYKNIFKTMVSLEILHLDGNNLGNYFAREHSELLFEGLINLKTLFIANNNIGTLHESVFKDQLSLQELHAEHNMLSSWEQSTFRFTKNLTLLDMSYNLIHVVEELDLQDLNDLRYLYLSGNPFNCNCDLLWFWEWITTTSTVLPNNKSYMCHGPKEWRQKPLSQFSRNKIDCTIKNNSDTDVIIGAVFAGLVILLIASILGYKIRWRVRLRLYLLSKRGKQFLKQIRKGNRRRNYGAIDNHEELFDAYISCSEHDKPWVLRHLLPGIDSGQLNDDNRFGGDFKLYFDDRDSEAGASNVANIVEHMVRSRNVIVVLSRHYFNGMNEFELDQATVLLHDHELADIIVVKLGELPARNIPPHLYAQMRKGRFIEWEDDEHAIQTFRAKLIERLQGTTRSD